MTPERWQKVKEIFQSALDRAPSERSAFLAGECGRDEALRNEVESLIASHEKDGSFIDSPAYETAPDMLTGDQELKPGQVIGSYEIISFISRGAMGEVYLAQDKRLSRKVALKLLPASFTNDGDRLRRFEQEARAASALNHPNIITIYEILKAKSTHLIATEFVEGETLRHHLSHAPPTVAESLRIAIQVGDALAAAHKAGIIHRDIKPENIMVRPDGYVKVLDFGLAKLSEHAPSAVSAEAPTKQVKTGSGIVMGTAGYMSPEQARGKSVDARSDIFSLGAVIYEIIARRQPFEGETPSDVLAAILKTDPPPISLYEPETPAELVRIATKALHKERDERYQTVQDLLLDLKSLQQELDIAIAMNRSVPTGLNSATREREPSGMISTPEPSTGQTAAVEGASTTSSVEYVVSQIKGHKRTAIAVLLIIALLAVAGIIYIRGKNAASIESIAVLPFVNVGGDADTEYLSDGLTESLINNLSQLRNLSVKSRSSVFRYKGKDIEPQTAANELGVQAVLLGRMTQRGDDLTLSVELVEARTGNQLWGTQYNRKLGDLVAMQSEVTRDVLEKLRQRLTVSEQQLATKHYTADPAAYQLYLKGRFYWNKRTEESFQKAIDYFHQAIEKDPNYALAYTGLADSYCSLSNQGIRPPNDVFPLAKQAATKAIAIDNSLSEAHTSLAYVKLYYDWDWAGAENEYKQAIALNPNYSIPHHGYAYLLISSGRTEAAIAEIKKAEEIDPLSLVIQADHGEFYYFARRPDEAIAQLQKAIDMDPSFVRAHFLLGRALIQKGRCDEGVDEAVKAQKLERANEALAWLAQEYASCGRRAEAQKAMNELMELSKDHYVSPHWFAAVQAGLGNKDEAFKWLDEAIERRFGPMIYLEVNPIWDPLRSDPRFAERLRRVGFTP